MNGGRAGTGPDYSPPREIHRWRRAREAADRPAGDTGALLRKARAVLMLRARQAASEACQHIKEDLIVHWRDKAACELHAARLMHRLVMARGRRTPGALADGHSPPTHPSTGSG